MKNALKLLRRLVVGMFLVCLLLPVLDLVILFSFTVKYSSNGSPYTMAEEVAEGLSETEDGYSLSPQVQESLKQAGAWAMLIQSGTGQVVWHTEDLPAEVPLSYSASDIASLTRGYVQDYPTFPASRGGDAVVAGYPKESFWKHMYPAWDMGLIKDLIPFAAAVILADIAVVILIYLVTDMKLLKSVGPIVDGIEKLSRGRTAYIRRKGLLSEIAQSVNKTSEILQTRNRELRKKETARANWIAGVSHDIRTPLSMVMGYAAQLADSPGLTEEERRKAQVICRQSQRMKNLINDLNLASKLEYNMQPVDREQVSLVALMRKTVVDFLNMDAEGKYPIEWLTREDAAPCFVYADAALLARAAGNLIQNSMNHNPEGCSIYVTVEQQETTCSVTVEDDGAGITEEKLEELNNAPHYMMCDENVTGQRHGLGLLIVRQIAQVHGGGMEIGHSPREGFAARIWLPLQDCPAGIPGLKE